MARLITHVSIPTRDERISLCSDLYINNMSLADIKADHVLVPFNYGRRPKQPPICWERPAQFCGQLTEAQQKIVDQARQNIDKYRSTLLTIYCGGGKTVILLNLLCQLNLPTIVLVPKKVLVQQWKERIATFCPTLDIIVQTGRCANFCAGREILVLDEVHQMFAPQNCKSLLRFTPQFLLGATATPWRPNEEPIFDLFFKPKSVISLGRPPIDCQVRVIWTGLRPPIESNGARLDWNAILNWQASDAIRTRMIIDECKAAPCPQLVLVKRLEAAHALNFDPAVTQIICGTTKDETILPTTKYVIATFSKLGTGFDHAGFSTLVLTSDVCEYFEQYAGRILRSLSGRPLFVDFVDDFFVLTKHYKLRREFYNSIGAKFVHKKMTP